MSSSESAGARQALNLGIPLVLVTVVVSGVSNFVNFRAVQGTDVDAWIAVRNAAVALLLVPLALVAGSGVRAHLARADWVRLVVIGLVGGAVPFLLYFHGFQMASAQGGAASASFGYRSLFLVASVLGVVLLRERLTGRFALAAGLVLAGNVLLLSFTGPSWTDGTAVVLLATLLWAGEYTLSKRALRTLPPATVSLGRMGFGAAFLLAYLGATGQAPAVLGFSGGDWMNLALSALLLLVFVATWYAGLKTLDVSTATGILTMAFPITWALGVLGSGTPVTAGTAVGAAAVVLGAGLLVANTLHRSLPLHRTNRGMEAA